MVVNVYVYYINCACIVFVPLLNQQLCLCFTLYKNNIQHAKEELIEE
jgi:hypothetical protein